VGSPPGDVQVPVAGYEVSVLSAHVLAGGDMHAKPTHGSAHAAPAPPPASQIWSVAVQSTGVTGYAHATTPPGDVQVPGLAWCWRVSLLQVSTGGAVHGLVAHGSTQAPAPVVEQTLFSAPQSVVVFA
jgi:hypothetical protein